VHEVLHVVVQNGERSFEALAASIFDWYWGCGHCYSLCVDARNTHAQTQPSCILAKQYRVSLADQIGEA